MPDSYTHTYTHTLNTFTSTAVGSEHLSVEAVMTLCHIIPHFQTGESLLGWLCQLLVICLGWGNYSPFFSFVLLSLLSRYFILLLTKWLSVDLECKYLCIFMHTFTVKVISRAVCRTLEWTVGLIRLYLNVKNVQSCTFLFSICLAFNIKSSKQLADILCKTAFSTIYCEESYTYTFELN